jgi:hypothetical protein
LRPQITFEQVDRWIKSRAIMTDVSDDTKTSPAFRYGMLAETFRTLLNNPHTRKDIIKEIQK